MIKVQGWVAEELVCPGWGRGAAVPADRRLPALTIQPGPRRSLAIRRVARAFEFMRLIGQRLQMGLSLKLSNSAPRQPFRITSAALH